jgi:hypothetical protein
MKLDGATRVMADNLAENGLSQIMQWIKGTRSRYPIPGVSASKGAVLGLTLRRGAISLSARVISRMR